MPRRAVDQDRFRMSVFPSFPLFPVHSFVKKNSFMKISIYMCQGHRFNFEDFGFLFQVLANLHILLSTSLSVSEFVFHKFCGFFYKTNRKFLENCVLGLI